MGTSDPSSLPQLSVVVPACNEAENVSLLTSEIVAALREYCSFEVVFVDDGSTDGTAVAVLQTRIKSEARIRLLRHAQRSGQSAALYTGVRASKAEWIATLDGDGQNDPADIPTLLKELAEANDSALKLVMGNRTTRKDTWLRRLSSRIANKVRRGLLGDGTPDTGCGIKIFSRSAFMELPHFDHMHRFLPVLFQRAGARVISVPVRHRPRKAGTSKYGLHDRLWIGIVDLLGVMWLLRRRPPPLSADEE